MLRQLLRNLQRSDEIIFIIWKKIEQHFNLKIVGLRWKLPDPFELLNKESGVEVNSRFEITDRELFIRRVRASAACRHICGSRPDNVCV